MDALDSIDDATDLAADMASPKAENELQTLPTNPPGGLSGILTFKVVSAHNLVTNRWMGKINGKVYLTAGRTVKKSHVAKGQGPNPVWDEEEWEFDLEPHDSTMSLRVFDDHMISPALIGYCVHYVTDFQNCQLPTRYELHLIDNLSAPVGTVMVDAHYKGDKGPTSISGLTAASKVLFSGYLESFTANEFLSKWKRKMTSEQELQRRWATFFYIVAVGSGDASTGLFLFTQDSPASEVRGYFNLAKYHCNCKPISCPRGEDPSFKYLQLVQNPDRKTEMPLIVRCALRDPAQRKILSNFTAACNERIRKANPFAVQYVRAFDREMFEVSNSNSSIEDDIPLSFVGYVTRYMKEMRGGIPQVGKKREEDRENLFVYLQEMLDEVLASTAMDENCYRCARTFSGFAAAVTRELMQTSEPPLPKSIEATIPGGALVWDHLQCLQEYQVRQLVEFCVFQDRHDSSVFSTWAQELPEVRALQRRVDANKVEFARDLEYHDLGKTKWLHQIRNAGSGKRYDDVDSLAGLFMPGLDLIQAMGTARSMSQKVRMWAEALVTCTGIVNSTNGVDNPIGAEDVPSLVLFLTCAVNDSTMKINGGIAAQAKLTNLFCLDSMATDEERYGLPVAGVYVDVGDQYAFNAEKRAMSPQFSLLWLDDVLVMIADDDDMSAGVSPRVQQALNSPAMRGGVDGLDDIEACFDLRESDWTPQKEGEGALGEAVDLEESLAQQMAETAIQEVAAAEAPQEAAEQVCAEAAASEEAATEEAALEAAAPEEAAEQAPPEEVAAAEAVALEEATATAAVAEAAVVAEAAAAPVEAAAVAEAAVAPEEAAVEAAPAADDQASAKEVRAEEIEPTV